LNEDKSKYREICNNNKIPLFSQHFWLDAVCGEDNWDVIVMEENGNVNAILPYYINKLGSKFEIRKAPLTQNNGVFFFYPPDMKYDRKVSFENRVLDKIIDRLEELNLSSYRQYFHYSFTNWLPFYWRGYTQSTRYTYVIDETGDLDNVYNNFNGNIRKHIRKAEGIVRVYNDMDYAVFYEMNKKTYERQSINIPYTYELFEKLYKNLNDKGCVEILYAKDAENVIHSAALFAYDHDTVYYLMSGSDEQYRDSQSLTLLIYEGIKLANRLGKKFDFEGSMKKNIEKFFRQFGAVQKQYFDIKKEFSDRI
jgi:lipid II:glycine glycyltransferase (peptidoglycan interpeptide bridge formation enzyme)